MRKESDPRALRRRLVAALLALALLGLGALAAAGSYLDRSQLLVQQATQEAEYLRHRLADRELARMVQRLAAGRLEGAREMMVPPEVVQAHPHLLLMLENYERAAEAAAEGATQRFLLHQGRARDEEQVFRSVLRQKGFPLPDEKKKTRSARDGT